MGSHLRRFEKHRIFHETGCKDSFLKRDVFALSTTKKLYGPAHLEFYEFFDAPQKAFCRSIVQTETHFFWLTGFVREIYTVNAH